MRGDVLRNAPGTSVSTDASDYDGLRFRNLTVKLFKFLCGNPSKKKGEGIFFRAVTHDASGDVCLQFVLFYHVQFFPFHRRDYHPFFIYLDRHRTVKYVFYDKGHHEIQSLTVPKSVKVMKLATIKPDHSFTPFVADPPFTKLKYSLMPMDDRVLNDWWMRDDMAQFKLRSYTVDPWKTSLFTPSHVYRGPSWEYTPEKFAGGLNLTSGLVERASTALADRLVWSKMTRDVPFVFTFRDEARCPKCEYIKYLDLMYIKGPRFELPVTCPAGHRYTAVYDSRDGKVYSEAFE